MAGQRRLASALSDEDFAIIHTRLIAKIEACTTDQTQTAWIEFFLDWQSDFIFTDIVASCLFRNSTLPVPGEMQLLTMASALPENQYDHIYHSLNQKAHAQEDSADDWVALLKLWCGDAVSTEFVQTCIQRNCWHDTDYDADLDE